MQPDLFRSGELAHRYFMALGWEELLHEPWAYRAPDGRVCRLSMTVGTSVVQAAYDDSCASFDAAVAYAETAALPEQTPSDIIPSGGRAQGHGWLRHLLSVARAVAIR